MLIEVTNCKKSYRKIFVYLNILFKKLGKNLVVCDKLFHGTNFVSFFNIFYFSVANILGVPREYKLFQSDLLPKPLASNLVWEFPQIQILARIVIIFPFVKTPLETYFGIIICPDSNFPNICLVEWNT